MVIFDVNLKLVERQSVERSSKELYLKQGNLQYEAFPPPSGASIFRVYVASMNYAGRWDCLGRCTIPHYIVKAFAFRVYATFMETVLYITGILYNDAYMVSQTNQIQLHFFYKTQKKQKKKES